MRDSIYARAREQLRDEIGPQLRTISPRAVERVRLDNAVLMARRVYLTDLDAFDAVLAREGGDLRRAVATIIEAAKGDRKNPFDAVKALARSVSAALTARAAPSRHLPKRPRMIARRSIAGPAGGSGGGTSPGSSTTTRCIVARTPRSRKRDS